MLYPRREYNNMQMDTERYRAIEARIRKGKGVKRFDQKGALEYIKNL